MLTSIRSLCAATFATGFALAATPALASPSAPASLGAVAGTAANTHTVTDPLRESEPVEPVAASRIGDESGLTVSANVALVSEYRFRGVDLSGGDIAIQGGLDLAHSSGFYVGTWASSLDEDTVGYGHTELDVYGGFAGNFTDAVSFDIGVIGYLYPDAGPGDFDYVELYGSLGFNLGPAEATVGVAYAPDQDSLGGTDNLYLYTDVGFAIPTTPLTVTAHLGYTDGFLTFTQDSEAFDWSVGVEAAVAGPVSVGVAYVGAEGDFLPGDYDFTDDTVVISLSASF